MTNSLGPLLRWEGTLWELFGNSLGPLLIKCGSASARITAIVTLGSLRLLDMDVALWAILYFVVCANFLCACSAFSRSAARFGFSSGDWLATIESEKSKTLCLGLSEFD